MDAARQAVRDGDLDEALRVLQQQVRKEPAASKPRIFLFQLFAVTGAWTRALNQLDILRELDPGTLAMVETYRPLAACEQARSEVFASGRAPLIFGEPEPWMAWLLEALRLGAAGRHSEAQALREQAFAEAPTAPGQLDAAPFAWIADADSRLGPMLEAMLNGRYYWIPFQRISQIEFSPPEDLRDLVWLPTRFTWANGGEAFGFVPTRYAGSEAVADAAIGLARKTDWIEMADGVYHGLGQRMLATDTGEYALLNCRSLLR